MAAPKAGETQTGRRAKYGLNVSIAIAAATVLVIIINVIGYKRLVPYRWDLTATRAWSLSPQTERVVERLEGDYRLVMLLSATSEYGDQAKGVISEYGFLSSNLTIEEIDPTNEGRMLKFYAELVERYTEEVKPMQQAIESGREALDRVRNDLGAQLGVVREVLEDKQLNDPSLKQFITQVSSAFARIESQGEDIDEQLSESLDSPLPDYVGAVNTLKGVLKNYDEDIFGLVIERFKVVAETPTAPDAIKNRLLRLVKMLEATREGLKAPIAEVNAVNTETEYGKLRTQVGPETVILIGPKDKAPRVIHLGEMFKQPDAQEMQQLEPGQIPERRFLGEEKITGALAAMQLEEQPMVVFVTSGQRTALGFNGQYQQVAGRLRNMNFDVQEWSLTGRPGPMGQPMPPGPPPEPDPGQKVVWVVTPIDPPNPMQPTPGGDASQKVVQHLSARLEMGDSALFMLQVSPMAGMGMGDPIATLVQGHGITAQTDRLILAEAPGRGGRTAFVANHTIETWPEGLPITSAISGMSGIMVTASPLVIKEGEADGTKTWKLVEIAGPRLWAETELHTLQSGDAKYKPENGAESFVVGAAVEKNDQRLVVVADPMWGSDQITTYGPLGPGTAQMLGAVFPANAELFVNSVFWLAHLDELIAAGARSQDIRRIDAMEEGSLTALRWTMALLMVLVPFGAGMGVWLVRRRN